MIPSSVNPNDDPCTALALDTALPPDEGEVREGLNCRSPSRASRTTKPSEAMRRADLTRLRFWERAAEVADAGWKHDGGEERDGKLLLLLLASSSSEEVERIC